MNEDTLTTRCDDMLPLTEDPYFREDYLALYYYDKETNEVVMLYKHKSGRLEASVLIETLAGAIIDISEVQSSARRVKT